MRTLTVGGEGSVSFEGDPEHGPLFELQAGRSWGMFGAFGVRCEEQWARVQKLLPGVAMQEAWTGGVPVAMQPLPKEAAAECASPE